MCERADRRHHEPSSWYPLLLTIAITGVLILALLVLAEEFRNLAFSLFQPLLDWTTGQNNAGAVQVATALVLLMAGVSNTFTPYVICLASPL